VGWGERKEEKDMEYYKQLTTASTHPPTWAAELWGFFSVPRVSNTYTEAQHSK